MLIVKDLLDLLVYGISWAMIHGRILFNVWVIFIHDLDYIFIYVLKFFLSCRFAFDSAIHPCTSMEKRGKTEVWPQARRDAANRETEDAVGKGNGRGGGTKKRDYIKEGTNRSPNM